MCKRISFFYIIFSLVTSYAQSKFKSIVLDASNSTPIEDVYVTLSPLNKTFLSNSLGRIEIANIPNGTYELKTSYVGYKDLVKEITITSDTIITLRLERDIESLSEIVVTGTRTKKTVTNSPILTRVVNAKDIENTGAVTASEIIELAMPGVHFSPDAHGDNLRIQGLNNDYILVLIDGQKLIGEMKGNVNFSRIPLANIEQIEVIKGASSSVLYGSNAIGGVINIITKKNSKKSSGTIEARYGSHNEFLTQVSGASRIKKTGLNFSFYRRSFDGYNLTPETSPNSYTVNPYEDYSTEISANRKITSQLQGSLNFRYYQHHLNNPKVSFEKEHKFTNNYTGGANLDIQLSTKNTLEIKLHKNFAQRFYITDATKFKYRKGYYDYNSLQLIDRFQISKQNQLLTGIEYSYENVFSRNFSEKEGLKRSVGTWNGFIQTDFNIIKNVESVVGSRYIFHEVYGFEFTSSLSLMYKNKNLRFRGNIAKGYRSPSLKEMYYNFDHGGFWIIGNPNLKPENSIFKSLSIEYSKKNIHFTTNFFHNEITNKIDYYQNNTNNRTELVYRNYGKTKVKGIEVNTKISLLKNYNIQLGYTYTDAKDEETGLQLRGNVKHSANSILGWKSTGAKNPITINISGKINSGQINETMSKRYNPKTKKREYMLITNNQNPYSLWKVNVNKTIQTSSLFDIMIYTGIDNIFDYKDSFLLTSGRTFYGGFKLLL